MASAAINWGSAHRRSWLLWTDTEPNEIGLHLGPRTIVLDYRIEPQNRCQKIGTNTDGWIAYFWDGTALKSTGTYVATAEYPGNGGTLTIFNSTTEVFEGKPRFSEIDNVDPFSDLMPGDTLRTQQELELISGIEANDPERWVEILGADD